MHGQLAIERGQLEYSSLWSHRAGNGELASGVVQSPEGVYQQGDPGGVHQGDALQVDDDRSRRGPQRGIELRGQLDAKREIELTRHG